MSGLVKYKVVYGAGIMGWLDYPIEHAEAVVDFLQDPEAFQSTTGHELDLAMREYLFVVKDDIKY
jgi:hypothetical protein